MVHVDSLYATGLRMTRDPRDAEDLVQDTYLKAFRAADRFEPGTNLRAWLFTILHNTARNRFRDRAHDAVTVEQIVAVLLKNAENACNVVREAVAALPKERGCKCGSTLATAIITQRDAIPPATKEKLKLIIGKYL